MPYKVFEFKGATDREMDDVRLLLHDNGIEYYETPRGNFGMSMAAIWVSDEQSYVQARKILEEYQAAVVARAKSHADDDKSASRPVFKSRIALYAFIFFIATIVIWRMFYKVSFF